GVAHFGPPRRFPTGAAAPFPPVSRRCQTTRGDAKRIGPGPSGVSPSPQALKAAPSETTPGAPVTPQLSRKMTCGWISRVFWARLWRLGPGADFPEIDPLNHRLNALPTGFSNLCWHD